MARSLGLGFALGFAIAASPGPIFFLCVSRNLARGWRSGLASGLGVATSDGAYALVAALGVGATAQVLLGQRRWLELVGGLALILIGLRTLRQAGRPARPAGEEVAATTGLGTDYLTTLGLTLANPPTILSFAAVFAGVGLSLAGGALTPAPLVAGVLAGSAAWWIALTGLVALLRERLDERATRAVSIVSGAAVVIFGLAAVATAIGYFLPPRTSGWR